MYSATPADVKIAPCGAMHFVIEMAVLISMKKSVTVVAPVLNAQSEGKYAYISPIATKVTRYIRIDALSSSFFSFMPDSFEQMPLQSSLPKSLHSMLSSASTWTLFT